MAHQPRDLETISQRRVLDYAPPEPAPPFKGHRLFLTPIACALGTFFELVLPAASSLSFPVPCRARR